MGKLEIIVPASTSNLGASFDACGLALSLYLRVTVEERKDGFEVVPTGEIAGRVPCDQSNFIVRVAQAVAEERRRTLSGARLEVDSQIPLARGLGSSSSAIIAGISVYEMLAGDTLSEEEIFRHALRFEAHGDNLAPSLLGGLVVACVVDYKDEISLVTIKREWPEEIRIVLAVPDFEMETARMREALPQSVPHRDAIFNVQRAALLQAAIAERRYDLISEALRDRLHQPYRAPLAAGISEVLRLNDEARSYPGLLAVAISGAGSSVAAFATEDCSAIAAEMQSRFEAAGVSARTMEVGSDNRGRRIERR